MRMAKLVGRTIKDAPREAELKSHSLMIRAGYIRQYSSGIYGFLPLAQKALGKIEAIIRQEMNKIDGQEVRMPCIMTKELWDESGRYDAIDGTMFRFEDRHKQKLLLGMTHEEAVVYMARKELASYRDLPAMLYQIQTKFRDEPRPRGGLIRTREFIMKDAYSFHTSEEDLKRYYDQVHEAYVRIYNRCGVKNFASVLSDNGMFGGRYSHEFMLLTPAGEDTLITCTKCDYKANQEIARTVLPAQNKTQELKPLREVSTPGVKTIADLAKFLKVTESETCKAVMYETRHKELVVALVRGDRQVVEQKLRTALNIEVTPATHGVLTAGKACAGSTGPLGLDYTKAYVVFDSSLKGAEALIVGANKEGVHFVDFSVTRDLMPTLSEKEKARVLFADIMTAEKGDPCPECQAELTMTRGVEIGNIFHLGDKYSKSMNCLYVDEAGRQVAPIMGCYGLGVTRLLASVIEESADDQGVVLPMTIAPYEVHLIALNYTKDEDVRSITDKLYEELRSQGIEVLFDDRTNSIGSKFADADLVGMPLRIVVGKKSLEQGMVEFSFRDKREPAKNISVKTVVDDLKSIVKLEYQRYAAHPT